MNDEARGQGEAKDASVDNDKTYAATLRKRQGDMRQQAIESAERALEKAKQQLEAAKEAVAQAKKENG